MTSNVFQAELVLEVIPAILLKETLGSVEGTDGVRRPETYPAGKAVTFYKSLKIEKPKPPRASGALSEPARTEYETLYSVKADHGFWTPYVPRDKNDARGVGLKQMVPHRSIAKTTQSAMSDEFFKPGQWAFIIQEVECKNVKAPNGKLILKKGERVVLNSTHLTLKGGEAKNHNEAHYLFQVLKADNPLPREWRSDLFLKSGVDYRRVADN